MVYAYLPGPEPPDTEIQMPEGQAIAGNAIGILVLDLWYPFLPGNVANASTYHFPVLFKVLKGSTASQILNAEPVLLEMIVAGGTELEAQGVRAIIGACGYFGHFQKEASARFRVPTFLSSVLQVPIILQGLKPAQKVGIICGSSPHLKPSLFSQCGVSDLSRLVIIGAENCAEFANLRYCTGHFNSRQLEQELVSLAKQLVSENPEVGALLLECSDMPPYAWAIQNAARLPVFDFITLINWVYNSVVRRPFAGFI